MFVLIEAVRGRLIGSKSWNRSVEIFEIFFCSVRISLGTDLVIWIKIYSINYVSVSRRSEMGMEFGSTKRNRCRKSGLPVDSPHALFLDCKNSPSLYEMDHKCPCVLAFEL